MFTGESNPPSISGEDVYRKQLDSIPQQHQVALYVVIKNILTYGEEALKNLRVEDAGDMVTVKLPHWIIRYRRVENGLDYIGLEYCA